MIKSFYSLYQIANIWIKWLVGLYHYYYHITIIINSPIVISLLPAVGGFFSRQHRREHQDLIQILATVPAVLQDAMALEAANLRRRGGNIRGGSSNRGDVWEMTIKYIKRGNFYRKRQKDNYWKWTFTDSNWYRYTLF